MPLEINLLAVVHATKMLAQHHMALVADGAEHYQSHRIAPVRNVVTRPADYIDPQQLGAADSLLFLVFPDFVPVQFFRRAAYRALAAAALDR